MPSAQPGCGAISHALLQDLDGLVRHALEEVGHPGVEVRQAERRVEFLRPLEIAQRLVEAAGRAVQADRPPVEERHQRVEVEGDA